MYIVERGNLGLTKMEESTLPIKLCKILLDILCEYMRQNYFIGLYMRLPLK